MLEHLTRLARHRAPQHRAELLAAVIDLYRAAGPGAEASLAPLFSEIVLQILPELSAAGQAGVGARLATLPNLPHALALALAASGGLVAEEILHRSPVLAEADLLHLVDQLGERGLLAIAARDRLSERVTDALIQRGEPALHRAVAANRSARLSAGSLRHIVAICGARDPAELRPAAEILSFPGIEPRRSERRPTDGGEGDKGAVVVPWPKAARTAGPDATPVAEAIAAIASSDRMLEVAMLLAAHAGLPPDLVSRLIARSDASLLIALCRAAGVSPATFSLIARIRGRRFGHPLKQTLGVEAAYAALSESEARACLLSFRTNDRSAGSALGG